MHSLGTRIVAVNLNSTFNLYDSPSSSGESKDNKLYNDTTPVDESTNKDDLFETQVVDYVDDDVITQPVELNDETQIMDIAGETQIMDIAGETQLMDDFDGFDGDTQLLTVSDSEIECESDEEVAGRTQVLDDTVHINDIQVSDTIDNKTDGGKNKFPRCQDDGGARAESLPSVDLTPHSDHLRKGFTSVRTASLRAAGVAARKMASKKDEKGSCWTTFSSKSSKGQSVNNDEIRAGREVDVKNDMVEHDENGLGNGTKSDVAKSLARKLFVEEDFAEGPDKEPVLRIAEISQQHGCDNDFAGLSYVDSQEPGELSQANALQFVDKFLKVNLLEPDEDLMHKHAVCEIVTPGAFIKGANSIARDANLRSRIASASVYEWDDKLEDEGGGEFFIKKRDLLVGNLQLSRKSGHKVRTFRHFETKVSQLPGRTTNLEQQNVHDNIMGGHSDSKLARGKNVSKFDKIDMEKNDKNFTDQLSCITSDRLASNAPSNAESADLLDVGIDTQMAAEAIEALLTATALVENSMAVEGLSNADDEGEQQETKNVSKKRDSAKRRSYTSNSGIVTRSQQNSGVESKQPLALKPRSKHLTKELKVDLVEPRVKRSRSSAKSTSSVDNKESSHREPSNVDSMGAENNFEGELHFNQSVAVKRRSLRKKGSTLMSVEKSYILNNLNSDNCTLNESRKRRQSVEGLHTRKRKVQGDMASVNLNTGVQTLNLTVAGDRCMLHGSSDKGRDLLLTCGKDIGSANNIDIAPKFAFGSIVRQTRSKRSPQSAECLEDGKGLHSCAIVSSENALKLSVDKLAECSSPAKETLADVSLGGLYSKMPESSYPINVTPTNLKTPVNVVSPICMGDEYRTPSCKKNLFLKKECYKLIDSEDHCSSPFRVLRQRRDINNIKVLFSQHLDGDIVKQQKKILSRLGFYEASSILEATHFVADMFTRTRNMLEAIANAKLVVTHLWLESCGQANCFIDEKSYILRDTKKEKELGFSMPMSLARASRYPILEGRRVLLTPNIKPSIGVISSLVKAVQGQAIGRLCRSTSNNEKLLDDLLILSCEEDFEVCSPLLEKGVAVYSSELLLNGIITQRLEYERHRLFVSHMKKTRSTLWLKKEGDKLLRVTKKS